MKEAILIKEGELFLKGLNKKFFEDILIKNIKNSLKNLGQFKLFKEQSTITLLPISNINIDAAMQKIEKIFGIASFCRAAIIMEKDLNAIKKTTIKYLKDSLKYAKNFKVCAKRSDKSFKLTSPDIAKQLGEFILNSFENLKVDLTTPEITINIEIRSNFCYVYAYKKSGAKGFPYGSSGDGIILLSGGIDSPVAGWMMAKRGLNLTALHFISPPYTGNRALQKVCSLVGVLKNWIDPLPLYIVNITKLQEEIKKNCPSKLLTIILRRAMLKIAEKFTDKINKTKNLNIKTLITGESLAQVASQTLSAINCTNSAISMPILRPLIGMDKEEIVNIAKRIESFNLSILPYEDCCTVFTPKHPKTNPNLFEIIKAEKNLDLNFLIENSVENIILQKI